MPCEEHQKHHADEFFLAQSIVIAQGRLDQRTDQIFLRRSTPFRNDVVQEIIDLTVDLHYLFR
ncbi:hypothetical protein [Streptomyces coffeae]|uniref:hypothetical protein n=1 Tax=Streptomyces coffeae TaxID=621382 RepID=UPI001F1F3BD4|nr:hypothetical protein [Streptomyces coffeae]